MVLRCLVVEDSELFWLVVLVSSCLLQDPFNSQPAQQVLNTSPGYVATGKQREDGKGCSLGAVTGPQRAVRLIADRASASHPTLSLMASVPPCFAGGL